MVAFGTSVCGQTTAENNSKKIITLAGVAFIQKYRLNAIFFNYILPSMERVFVTVRRASPSMLCLGCLKLGSSSDCVGPLDMFTKARGARTANALHSLEARIF